MSLIKRNGGRLSSLPSLLDDDIFFPNFRNWGLSNFLNTGTTIPGVNIKETPDSFEVEMAAPGMKKDDFKIELDGNQLTISSEKETKLEDKKDGEKYSCKEFNYEAFQRSFTLPKDVVDEEKIEAHYDNGMLRLSIPRQEKAKQRPAKMIEVV